MKKVEIKCIKFYNTILGAIMVLLGFTNCSKIIDPKDEYGTPSATYKVLGQVTDKSSNRALPNIRVVMMYDSTLTDSEGNYEVVGGGFPGDQTFLVQFKDIDGVENGGTMQQVDTLLVFVDPEYTGGDGSWYQGEASIEFNIKLDPQ